MEDMLAMVGLDGTADMGKGEEPVAKVPAQPDVPAPTTAAASPLPLTPAPGPESTRSLATLHCEKSMTRLPQTLPASTLTLTHPNAPFTTASAPPPLRLSTLLISQPHTTPPGPTL